MKSYEPKELNMRFGDLQELGVFNEGREKGGVNKKDGVNSFFGVGIKETLEGHGYPDSLGVPQDKSWRRKTKEKNNLAQ